jgi:hypothetical protein
MKWKTPTVATLAALTMTIVAAAGIVQAVVMVLRFGAIWDGAFFLALGASLFFVARGLARGVPEVRLIAALVLGTMAARALSTSAPILRYQFVVSGRPWEWIGVAAGLSCALLAGLLLVKRDRRPEGGRV